MKKLTENNVAVLDLVFGSKFRPKPSRALMKLVCDGVSLQLAFEAAGLVVGVGFVDDLSVVLLVVHFAPSSRLQLKTSLTAVQRAQL